MNRTYAVATVLSANAVSYKGQMAIASRALDDFDRQGQKTASNVSKVGTAIKLAFAAAAVTVGALAFAAVSMATDFDRAMRNVNSISKLSEDSLASLSAQVIDLSTQFPQSARTLAEGLYDIASSGFQGAEGMAVLEASARAASAGMSTTQTAAQAIVAVLNAYGLSAEDAAHVSDVLFQTVNVGVVSFDELASSMGNVVGMAAAANISIEEVGAAMAAMTLAGISAAEASTSLARLTQSLIDPSDELLTVLQNLGYETGFTALETEGLHGVMEKLRAVTGGNVEALLKLFPEVRAARGAFALMSADGANYAATFDAITDKTKVAGATQAAFAEQMKGLGAQVDLFMNKVNAGLITLGTKAIPVLIDALAGLQTAGTTIVRWAQDLGRLLAPFFEAAVEAGGNLVNIAGDLRDAFEPFARLLGQIAGGAVIGALTGLAVALEAVTGFLAEHETLVRAIAILMMSRWVLAFTTSTRVVQAFAGMMSVGMGTLSATGGIISNVITRLGMLTQALVGIGGAGTYVTNLKGAFAGLGGVIAKIGPTVGITLLIGEFVAIAQGFATAKRQAEELVESIETSINPQLLQPFEVALDRVNIQLDRAKEKKDAYSGILGGLRGIVEVLTPLENGMIDATAATYALSDELFSLTTRQFAFNRMVADLGEAAGLTSQEVRRFAESLGIDLLNLPADKVAEVAVQITEAANAAAAGTPQTDELSTAYETLADITTTATDKIKAFKDELDALIGKNLGVFDTTTRLQQGFNDLNGVLDKYGFQLDETLEGGIEVRDALSGLVQKAIDAANALADKTGSIEEGRNKLIGFRDTLRELLSTRGYDVATIDELIASFGLDDATINTQVAVDIAGAQTNLDTIKTELDALASTPTTVTPVVDTAPFMTGIAVIDGVLAGLINPPEATEVPIGIDPDAFKTGVAELDALLGDVFGQPPVVEPKLQDQSFRTGVGAVDALLDNVLGRPPVTTPSLNAGTINSGLASVDALMNSVLGTPPVVTPRADTAYAESQLNYLARPRDVYIRPVSGAFRWGGIRMYAAGGTASRADILRQPTAIAGEAATGGEAYIPRRGSAARNRQILEIAASWQNMAVVPRGDVGGRRGAFGAMPIGGGVTGGGAGGGGVVIAPQLTVSVTASTVSDQQALQGTVMRVIGPAFDDLTQRITRELQTRR